MALTEGVIGYLTVDQVASRADDLLTMPSCELWVTEYFSRRQLRRYQARQPMPAVPVRFDPTDWEGFFTSRGWSIEQIRYLGEESRRLERPVPLTWTDKLMRAFTSRPLRNTGYVVLDRED
jgi:O-methyltransferase involved in polyketide biosynthesis